MKKKQIKKTIIYSFLGMVLFAITPMILVSCSDSTQKSSNQQQTDNKIKFEYNIDKKYQNIYDKSIFETNKSFLEIFDGNNAIWARGDVGNPPTYVEYIYQKDFKTTQFKYEGNILEFTLEYKLNIKILYQHQIAEVE